MYQKFQPQIILVCECGQCSETHHYLDEYDRLINIEQGTDIRYPIVLKEHSSIFLLKVGETKHLTMCVRSDQMHTICSKCGKPLLGSSVCEYCTPVRKREKKNE